MALRAGVASTEQALAQTQAACRQLQDERTGHQARISDLEAQLHGLRIREAHLVEEIDRHAHGLDAIRRSTA
ncbi:hypothetical protein, partial [Chitiniphilus shinanonensis]